jgi:hypothetical protein
MVLGVEVERVVKVADESSKVGQARFERLLVARDSISYRTLLFAPWISPP